MPVEATPSNDPRALEAAGAQTVTFDFRGGQVTIPFPIEAWPLDDIAASRNGRALKALLGGQRPTMATRADAAELSHRMADACGLTPLPHTKTFPGDMFGAAPALLRALGRPDDLEADLRRFYHLDYRDRWRATLTLRHVWVCVRRLPHDAALLVDAETGDQPWTRGDIIGARSWEMFTRQWYPGRPWSREERAEAEAKRAKDEADMAKLADREAYYSSGQNMRDAGVDPGPRTPVAAAQRRQPRRPTNAIDAALQEARTNAAALQQRGTHDGRRKPGAAVLAQRRAIAESGW
jgi:hypothetical protein